MRKGKVFEIKVASSASFYSYLALSGIDFKTKEKQRNLELLKAQFPIMKQVEVIHRKRK